MIYHGKSRFAVAVSIFKLGSACAIDKLHVAIQLYTGSHEWTGDWLVCGGRSSSWSASIGSCGYTRMQAIQEWNPSVLAFKPGHILHPLDDISLVLYELGHLFCLRIGHVHEDRTNMNTLKPERPAPHCWLWCKRCVSSNTWLLVNIWQWLVWVVHHHQTIKNKAKCLFLLFFIEHDTHFDLLNFL